MGGDKTATMSICDGYLMTLRNSRAENLQQTSIRRKLVGYCEKLIERKRCHLMECEALKYEIQRKPIKSRLDKDKIQAMEAQIMRIEQEIEELRR